MQYTRVLQCSRTGLGSAPTCTRVLAAVSPANCHHVQRAPRRGADAHAASHAADTTGKRRTQCRAAYSYPAAGTTTSGPAAPADAAPRNATFELACPICQDTQFDLRADRCVCTPFPPSSTSPPVRTFRPSSMALAAFVRQGVVCCLFGDAQCILICGRSLNEPLYCARCARTFNTEGGTYVDLTLSSGVTQRVYNESQWGGVELFR